MRSEIRFSVGIGAFAGCGDRFMMSGYKDTKPLSSILEAVSTVGGLEGIELIYPWNVKEDNRDEVKGLLKRHNLKLSILGTDLACDRKWQNGSLTSKKKEIREEAKKVIKNGMDMALNLGCDKINLWFGQDGYDYSFQADYGAVWDYLVEGIRECADYQKETKICIEYKIKEPRTHLFVSTVGKALLLAEHVDSANVGVNVDVGHALNAYENMAESVTILSRANKLFFIHLNDNYRSWDDDMMVGSVHIMEYLELLYWLQKIGYNSWYSLDIFPYREDSIKAAVESIEWIKGLQRLLNKVGHDKIEEVIKKGDAVKASNLIRSVMLK